MKIKAKEVKLGMKIGWGVITITVEKITNGMQKNGIETISFEGVGTRSMGKGYKPLKEYKTDFTVKSETFLDLK